MLVTALIVVLILFGGPIVVAGLFGRSFVYFPTRVPTAALTRPGWRVDKLFVDTEVVLTGTVRPPAEPDAPWLLFFGGNAMGLDSSQIVLEQCRGLARGPVGLAAFAYRGFDGSGGVPEQAGLTADAEKIAAHLEREYALDPSRLVIVGQSLGSGIAAHLAAALAREGRPALGLALLSPYVSIARLFDEKIRWVPLAWVAPDPYRTDQLVDDLPAPIVLVHGEDDTLIPADHTRELARLLGARAQTVLLEGVGHNDLWESPATARAIAELATPPVAAEPR